MSETFTFCSYLESTNPDAIYVYHTNYEIVMLALALPITQASALGITIVPSTRMWSGAAGINAFGNEDAFVPTGSDPFAVQTSITSGLSTSNATWSFENTAALASFSGSHDLFAEGDAFGRSTVARARTLFDFTLTEAVTYAVTGDLEANLGGQGSAADIIANLLTGTGFPPIGDLYHDADSVSSLVATFVPLQLDNAGFAQGSSNGTLGPGTYRFFFDNVIRDGLGGSGSGNFKLTLTAQGIPSVPEDGWTLALICMALCTLGGFARCCKVG
jgi:hypothetical protein